MRSSKHTHATTRAGLALATLLLLSAGPALAAGPKAAAGPKSAAPPASAEPAKAPVRWGKLVSRETKKVHWLTGPEAIIGSDESATVRLQHASVTGRHARLTHKDGVVHISDLKSRFGTLLDGTLVRKNKKMQIFQPTLLTFGAVTLRFEWGERGKLIKPLRRAPKAKRKKGKRGRSSKAAKKR